MRFVTCIFILLTGISGLAQEYSVKSNRAIKHFEKARDYFSQKQDVEAETFLWKAVDKEQDFVEAWFMLAQIYMDKQNGEKAAEYYLKGLEIDPDKFGHGYLKVANIEFNIGQYAESMEHLDIWNSFGFNDPKSQSIAKDLGKNLAFALEAVKNPVPFNPESLGPDVNTDQYEYWPSLSVDEKTLFFTVLGPPNPGLPAHRLEIQEDFYYAKKENAAWVDRTWLGEPVNTNANEGAQTITADGKYIFFTACNRPDGYGRMCDIYYSGIDEDGRWSKPVNLGEPVNTVYSEKHPAISADGRTLYFTSNRPGGKGDFDLWMSERTGDSWSKPVNMGDSINTAGTEQSPFIHPDQKSLYFSSDGWPGMGRGDIFLARMNHDGTWSSPVNLGYPINTHNEEVGFIVNARGNRAYYSTNRREGTDTDIYTFDMPEKMRPNPVSYITGRVYDSRNMKGLEARFQLLDLGSGKLVMESVSNPGEGNYLVSLPAGAAYAFNVSQPGYLFYSDHFELVQHYDKLDPYRKDIPLEPILQGKKIVLNNIFFDTDSYKLKEASRVELGKLFEFLELNSDVSVEISGHTDNTGTANYNLELSEKRAEEVVAFLTARGIQDYRLKARGYGDTVPVADNDTEAGRSMNRRTELKIL